jgi:hypothetical protein
VTDKSECVNCADNPIYANIPKKTKYQEYIPLCPRGYSHCVNDPAYLKCYHAEWYKEMYGDLTPEQVVEKECLEKVKEDPDEEYYCYDDEDK